MLKGAAARILIYWLSMVLAQNDDGSLPSQFLGEHDPEHFDLFCAVFGMFCAVQSVPPWTYMSTFFAL